MKAEQAVRIKYNNKNDDSGSYSLCTKTIIKNFQIVK